MLEMLARWLQFQGGDVEQLLVYHYGESHLARCAVIESLKEVEQDRQPGRAMPGIDSYDKNSSWTAPW